MYFVHGPQEQMAALCYEKIVAILEQARRIDQKCQLFGASEHQYKLNPPLNAAGVRLVGETYHFTFPEDYFQFITQVADGGAEPDYGIMPFEASLRSEAYNDFQEAYKRSLKTPFVPRPMMPEDVERHSFSKDSYERNPDQFLICEKGEDDICGTDGFWVLGTHGCQWDFGLVVSGGRKGQVFTADNEGAYAFEAYSFHEFYQRWLDWLSDPENIRKELKKWCELLQKRT